MISYTMSAAWSCLVLSLCCTEPGSSRDVVLSGRITTVAMYRSGQLGLCCTVEPNCSGLSARHAGASVIRNRALDTCELSCVSGPARHFFIPMVHSSLGPWGTWQHRSSPLEETEPRAMGHVAAPEPRDSKEVRSGAVRHVVAPERTFAGRCGPKLQLTWQRVDAHPTPCIDLKLIYGGTRSSECRHMCKFTLV
jgi:hypothetical protein